MGQAALLLLNIVASHTCTGVTLCSTGGQQNNIDQR